MVDLWARFPTTTSRFSPAQPACAIVNGAIRHCVGNNILSSCEIGQRYYYGAGFTASRNR